MIDLDNYNATFEGNGNVVPNSLVYVTKDGVEEKKFSGQKAGFSVILIPYGDTYRTIMADPLQVNSVFTRLFFLEGHGMKCFSKFDYVKDSSGQRIITWKVDYGCQQDNRVYFKEPVAETSEE